MSERKDDKVPVFGGFISKQGRVKLFADNIGRRVKFTVKVSEDENGDDNYLQVVGRIRESDPEDVTIQLESLTVSQDLIRGPIRILRD